MRAFSSQQRAEILADLETVLSSSAFAGSKRSCEFLDFIVRKTLEGDLEHLTERFLGVDLFHRPLDYETSTDAIVRVQACEVRRRLARFSQNQSPSRTVEIKLAPGSYIPEFVWPQAQIPEGPDSSCVAVAREEINPGNSEPAKYFGSRTLLTFRAFAKHSLLVVCLLVLAGITALAWWHAHRNSDHALKTFWAPVLKSSGAVDIRFGDYIVYGLSSKLQNDISAHRPLLNVDANQIVESKNASISSGSLQTAINIFSLLERHGVSAQLQLPQDFQNSNSPAPQSIIYVGAFNNPWTMELNRNLRFAFVKRGDNEWSIVEQGQTGRIWSANPYQLSHDYALITRIYDQQHKQVLISVGAISQYGTQAAGKFLTDENSLGAFERIAPRGWEHKNLQIVLAMDISDNRVIDPRIIATNIW